MSVKQCSYCGVANSGDVASCHNCGGRFKEADRIITPGSDEAARLDPTNHVLRSALRQQHAIAACRALSGAAFLSGVRGVLMPFLVQQLPPQFDDHATPWEIRITSLCLAVMFACMALWSRREPLSASIMALLIYLAFSIPDVVMHPSLMGGGHLGKVVMLLVLARALAMGLMHRNVGPSAVT